MRIVISALAILFGALHFAAACTQFKSNDPTARGFAVAMACGGVAVAFAAIAHLARGGPGLTDALSAATGCLLICFPAYANGKRAGNVHLSHHIVRGAAAVLLAAGFLIW